MRRERNKDVRGEGRGRGTPSLLKFVLLSPSRKPLLRMLKCIRLASLSFRQLLQPVLSRRVTLKKIQKLISWSYTNCSRGKYQNGIISVNCLLHFVVNYYTENICLFLNVSREHVNVCVSTASIHSGIILLQLISVWCTASPQSPERVDPFSTSGVWHTSVDICEKQGHVHTFFIKNQLRLRSLPKKSKNKPRSRIHEALLS